MRLFLCTSVLLLSFLAKAQFGLQANGLIGPARLHPDLTAGLGLSAAIKGSYLLAGPFYVNAGVQFTNANGKSLSWDMFSIPVGVGIRIPGFCGGVDLLPTFYYPNNYPAERSRTGGTGFSPYVCMLGRADRLVEIGVIAQAIILPSVFKGESSGKTSLIGLGLVVKIGK